MAFIIKPIPTVKNVINKKVRTAQLDPFDQAYPIDNDPSYESDLQDDDYGPVSPVSPQGDTYSQASDILYKQFRGQRYV